MKYFYDENEIRYNLASTNGGKAFNWLFVPGGPGADSSYFLSLVQLLQPPGNAWLIDLPGNGSHTVWKEGFDKWLSMFVPMIKRFENPILVGHSFGGQLPFLYEELEDILKGFVILNGTPTWSPEEAVRFAKEHNLPNFREDMKVFVDNPNQTTFKQALAACTPYYFRPDNLEFGKSLLKELPFAYEPAVWWQNKVVEIAFDVKWLPQKVKTLIIGGEYDGMLPFSLFEKDSRFDRENIEKVLIKNAGHFTWIEEPEKTRKVIKKFEESL